MYRRKKVSAAKEGVMQRREFIKLTGITSFLFASGHILFSKLFPASPAQTSPPDIALAIEKSIKAGFGEGFRVVSFQDRGGRIHADIEHLENRYAVTSGNLIEWKILASSVS
jgi:hypothetical protein